MNDEQLQKSLNIVWMNMFRVVDYLALFETVGKNSKKLNEKNGHFWGTIQGSSRDLAVLNICKLFDETNKRYEKDTIPSLIEYLESQLSEDHCSILDNQLLCKLGVCKEVIQALNNVKDKPEEFVNIIKPLTKSIKDACPSSNHVDLKKLFRYRNKVLAHQEQLVQAQKRMLRSLPSIDKMLKLATWAENFCQLTNKLFFPRERLPEFLPYLGKQTNDVITKCIEK